MSWADDLGIHGSGGFRSWLAVVESLAILEANVEAHSMLRLGLDTDGHTRDAQVVDHTHQVCQQCLLSLRRQMDVANQVHVKLDVLRADGGQLESLGLTGTEAVVSQTDTQLSHCLAQLF